MSSEFARVTSVEALKDFRADLCTFGERARDGLSSVQMAVQRTADWIEGQEKSWQREVRALGGGRQPGPRRAGPPQDDPHRRPHPRLHRAGRHPPGRDAPPGRGRAEAAQACAAGCRPSGARWTSTRARPGNSPASSKGEQPRALALLQQKIEALEAYARLDCAADYNVGRGPGDLPWTSPPTAPACTTSLKDLAVRWQEVQDGWDDPVRREFEEGHWAMLEVRVLAALRAMDQLATIMTQARHDCS